FAYRGRADARRMVCKRYMERVGVGIGIDSDRARAHGACGPHDAQGNLAAIGHKERGHVAVCWIAHGSTAQRGLRFSTKEATPSRASSLSMRSAKFSAAA